jgi:hypothetical protein
VPVAGGTLYCSVLLKKGPIWTETLKLDTGFTFQGATTIVSHPLLDLMYCYVAGVIRYLETRRELKTEAFLFTLFPLVYVE